MFKQIFRVAFITLVWKQYKRYILSTISLLAYLYLVGNLHADFLRLAELEQDIGGLKMSYVYKWLASAGGIGLYSLYVYVIRSRHTQTESKKEIIKQELAALDDKDDPFSAIRSRKTLRSRADFLEEEENRR